MPQQFRRSEYTELVAVMNRSLPFWPPKVRLDTISGRCSLPSRRAVRVEAVQPVVGGGPDPARVVEADPVKRPRVAGREHLATAEAVAGDLEAPDVPPPCVDDVELGLVGGECEPVRAAEVVGDDHRVARQRIEAVDVARADLADGPVPLVVTIDPVARVGEPDRAVGMLDDVVRAVEPLAVVAVGQHGHASVGLGPGERPMTLLAGDQPTLPVDRVAVGVAGRGAEDADCARQLVEPQHPVVGDVAEQQVAPRGEVRRPLRPAATREHTLDPLVALAATKPFVDDLELCPGSIHFLTSTISRVKHRP